MGKKRKREDWQDDKPWEDEGGSRTDEQENEDFGDKDEEEYDDEDYGE